jgi:protein TonB
MTGRTMSSGWIASGTFGGESHVQGKRAAGATAASVAFHAILLAIIVAFFTIGPKEILPVEPMELPRLVFLQQPGPGGGGGGSPAPAPPKPVEIPRSKPPEPIPVVTPPPVPPPPIPPPTFTAPVTTNATIAQATGSSSVSLAAYGGGGQGTGLGTGRGRGVGEGEGGGFGTGAYRLGSDITYPKLVKSVNPTYTSEAMRAKITGIVVLEVVILPNGTVGDVRVQKSLERGLDQEAIKAAKLWLFTPGRDRNGNVIPVVAPIELTFRLH